MKILEYEDLNELLKEHSKYLLSLDNPEQELINIGINPIGMARFVREGAITAILTSNSLMAMNLPEYQAALRAGFGIGYAVAKLQQANDLNEFNNIVGDSF